MSNLETVPMPKVAHIKRDVLVVEGPDAQSFLQGQVTQDIDKLTEGDSALAFILQPHGKVDALVRVSKTSSDRFLIDVDAGYGTAVLERLKRFKLRVKCELTLEEGMNVTAIRSRQAFAAATIADQTPFLTADAHWPGFTGTDFFYKGDAPQPATVTPAAFDALRIQSGMPAMGKELDEKTIPGEAGINALAIDFRKGCYTGQELVARIESRGSKYPRFLAGMVLEGEAALEPGMDIHGQGSTAKPIGTVTSAAWSDDFGAPVALVYMKRDTPVPGLVQVETHDGLVPARLLRLPMEEQ